jgi:hypothetical protein
MTTEEKIDILLALVQDNAKRLDVLEKKFDSAALEARTSRFSVPAAGMQPKDPEGRLPQAPVRPGVGATADPAAVDAVLASLSYLGSYAPSRDEVGYWLRKGYSQAAILAAVERYIEQGKAEATHASGVAPGEDWRPYAAFLVVSRSHQGWEPVVGYLQGKEPPPEVDPREHEDIFRSAPQILTRTDMAAYVPEVIRRAELGIQWGGGQGRFGADLEAAKAALVPGSPTWLSPEWDGWADQRLLRVAVLSNAIPHVRPILSSYPSVEGWKSITLEDWLWAAWRASRPNVGSGYWDGQS